MHAPTFLTLAEVIGFHAAHIQRYGGSYGVRDAALLESALAQPEAVFSGEFLHRDLYEMAAAYAYHLCQNHPFFDGNKRVALACALTFLELNGVTVRDPHERLRDAMFRMASGKMPKQEFAALLRRLARSNS